MGTGPASNNLREAWEECVNVKKIKLLFGKVIIPPVCYYIKQ